MALGGLKLCVNVEPLSFWHGHFGSVPPEKLKSVRREISTVVSNAETALQIGKIESSFMLCSYD
jgi:hypothetical protein